MDIKAKKALAKIANVLKRQNDMVEINGKTCIMHDNEMAVTLFDTGIDAPSKSIDVPIKIVTKFNPERITKKDDVVTLINGTKTATTEIPQRDICEDEENTTRLYQTQRILPKDCLRALMVNMSNEDARKYINGVYVDTWAGCFVSTDGTMMTIAPNETLQNAKEDKPVIIPRNAIVLADYLLNLYGQPNIIIAVSADAERIIITGAGNKKTWGIDTKANDDNYPSWQNVAPKDTVQYGSIVAGELFRGAAFIGSMADKHVLCHATKDEVWGEWGGAKYSEKIVWEDEPPKDAKDIVLYAVQFKRLEAIFDKDGMLTFWRNPDDELLMEIRCAYTKFRVVALSR